STTPSRGQLLLFWKLYLAPILLVLVADKVAAITEMVTDDVTVGQCIAVLKGIFGKAATPHLQETIVIAWRTNSLLALPTTGQGVKCRLCSGGEHIIRNYPATAHGPILSGHCM
ncbi:hypothetical protein B7P43_G16255, partial [Cryptotermes secundus]